MTATVGMIIPDTFIAGVYWLPPVKVEPGGYPRVGVLVAHWLKITSRAESD